MTKAEKQAIQDIKSELRDHSYCFVGKSFISFRKYLNPVMKALVKQRLKEQESLKTK